jgi:hypothetical protein
MRDLDTIDSELRRVAAIRGTARARGGPLPLIDVADALLDERLRAHLDGRLRAHRGYNPRAFLQFPI